jgi:anthraniloyl-CoA monooxygenase
MSQEEAVAFCERLFARYLDGHALISNANHLRGSANWIRFPRVMCKTWVHHRAMPHGRVPIVLMGDAAHTAHFSIGSGTKLALEDAIDLATRLRGARHRGRPIGCACCRTTRPGAAWRCSRSRTRRATRPSGSRTWTATPACRSSSSPIRC